MKMSTYTFTNKYGVTHKWVIKDFNEYLILHEDIQEYFSLYSSNFFLNKTDKKQFKLELRFNKEGTALKKCLSFFLNWCNFDQPERIKFELFLLNNKNLKDKTITTTCIASENASIGLIEFYDKKELLTKAEELLPYNTLTIGCEVFVYNEPINIPSIYERNSKHLIENQFRELLESGNNSDFIFKVDDQVIKVHKLILMARSPVFKAMLESEMVEKRTDQATIMDIRPEIFKIMTEFIYTDKVAENNLTKNDTIELLVAADKYQLENLKDICGEFLYKLIDYKNAMEILSLAEQHNIEQLKASVKDFIKANKQEVLSTIDSEYFEKNGHHASIFLF